jgi:hypothetical protein
MGIKEIKVIGRSIENNQWVSGYYWLECPFVPIQTKGTEDKHYIRYQVNYDWNLYFQKDVLVDPNTIHVIGDKITVCVNGGKVIEDVLRISGDVIGCGEIESIVDFLNLTGNSSIS